MTTPKEEKKQAVSSHFLKKVGITLSGSVISQAVFFLSSILLVRLYLPEQFGRFAFFLSGANILAIVLTGRYENTIVLAHARKDYSHLFFLSLILSFLLAMVFSILHSLFSPLLAPSYVRFGFLIIIGALFSAVISTFYFLFIRQGQFLKLSYVRIFFAISISCLQLLLFHYFFSGGLYLGYLVGSGITIGLAAALVQKYFDRSFEWNHLGKMARKYFSITRWSLPSSLVNSLTSNIQPILIALTFGEQEAGFFFMAYRLIGMPLNLFSGAISQVFYQEVTEAIRQKKIKQVRRLTLRITIIMAALVSGVSILIYLFAESIFAAVLGADWAAAGRFAIWLTPYFLGKAIFNPISSLAEALDKTKAELYFSAFVLFVVVMAVYLGDQFNSIRLFIGIFSMGGLLAYSVLWVYFYTILKQGNNVAKG